MNVETKTDGETAAGQKPLKIYELHRGDTFRINSDCIEGVLRYLKMDGMYAQVQHTDPDLNTYHCSRYDSGANFFCLHCCTEVTRV